MHLIPFLIPLGFRSLYLFKIIPSSSTERRRHHHHHRRCPRSSVSYFSLRNYLPISTNVASFLFLIVSPPYFSSSSSIPPSRQDHYFDINDNFPDIYIHIYNIPLVDDVHDYPCFFHFFQFHFSCVLMMSVVRLFIFSFSSLLFRVMTARASMWPRSFSICLLVFFSRYGALRAGPASVMTSWTGYWCPTFSQLTPLCL